MGSKTNYLEKKLLDHALGVAAYTHPTPVYLAVFTTDPTDAGTQTGEPSGGSYAREEITFGAASGDSPGTSSNSVAVTFTTATGSWGTLAYWGIMDAVSAGNMLYHGAATDSRAIDAGDTLEAAIGAIVITED